MKNISKCEKCGSDEIFVKDSRAASYYVRRRRECQNCGVSFTTREIHIADFDEMAEIIKRNDTHNILSGIFEQWYKSLPAKSQIEFLEKIQ